MVKKSPFAAIGAALLLLIFLVPGILLFSGFCLPAQFGETYPAALPDKLACVKSADSPRLILVGGSGAAFAVDCSLLSHVFPEYTPVNFGLYASIGTPVMLEFLQGEVRPGDVIVIMPEQNPQALSTYTSPETLLQGLDGHWELLKKLSPSHFSGLAAAFPQFAGKKLRYFFTKAPVPGDIYARSSFNSYGDIDSPLRSRNRMAGLYDPNQEISFDPALLSPDFVAALNAFARDAKAAGAKVYYGFAPMNRDARKQDGTSPDAFYDALSRQLEFPILGDPNLSLLDSGWFYDTNFHLNSSGAVVFTGILIDALKVLWQDTRKTELALPPMPVPENPETLPADNRDADCFLYRQEGDEVLISGLTDAGKEARSLVIPGDYRGKPVVGFTEDCFPESQVLRQVTLGSGLRVLPDGLFARCPRLQRVYLPAAPQYYTVGGGLRQGEFLLYVPARYLEDYRLHYSWQQYARWIFPQEEP